MRKPIAMLVVAILVPAAAPAAPATQDASPYAGMETRAIKALSAEEIEGYLAGNGMGFAMPAELNGYPGPKHVLDLASDLGLTEEQAAATRKVFDEMKKEAVALGASLVERERELDALFAGSRASEESLKEKVSEAGRTREELRLAHLRAHLAMKEILSAEQIAAYVKLRGYGAGFVHDPAMHHQHHGR